MTGLLVSAGSVAESAIALSGGADVIDLKDPAAGALGAVPLGTVRAVSRRIAGRRPVSATIGDHVGDSAAAARRVRDRAVAGAAFVKVGFFSGGDHLALARALGREARRGTRIVAVLFADQDPDFSLLQRFADYGLAGAMLDTAEKGGLPLRRCLDDERLRCFVESARALGMMSGLAGSLALDDVAPLIGLGADYLGFRGALCVDGRRAAGLDDARIAAIRAAIPAAPPGVIAAAPPKAPPPPPARTAPPPP